MRIIRDFHYVETHDRGASAAIGNFDGVHLGHQAVINLARQADERIPLGVVTFEPHPREHFAPDSPPFRLMSARARASRLKKLGVKKLYELNFNTSLATLSPEEFAQKVIHQGLGLSHIVVGTDFYFGKGRAGSTADLRRYGQDFGFSVTIADLIEDGNETISSTAIRTALSNGNPKKAAQMLGHWHRIESVVVRGEQRGRELGFPTANLSIEGLHPPMYGVYAVLIDILDGQHLGAYQGVASLGVRPMFGENQPNLETYLFDFSGDLYGTTLSIGFVDFLRPEKTFDTQNELIAQMAHDCHQARTKLRTP